jgi:hypothetical protein
MDWNWVYGIAVVAVNNLVLYVWKPWAGAYSGEKGKNLARKEDLKEILEEVRAVAATQKEVEAQQMILNQRRDAYVNLIKALDGFMEWSGAIILKQEQELGKKEEGIVHAREVDVSKMFADLREAQIRAEIFASSEVWNELLKYGEVLRGGHVIDLDRFRAWNEAAQSMSLALIKGAKKDLRIEPEEPSRTYTAEKSAGTF